MSTFVDRIDKVFIRLRNATSTHSVSNIVLNRTTVYKYIILRNAMFTHGVSNIVLYRTTVCIFIRLRNAMSTHGVSNIDLYRTTVCNFIILRIMSTQIRINIVNLHFFFKYCILSDQIFS